MVLSLCPAALAQTAASHKLIETTVCKILDDPSRYNNNLAKVRGYVEISSEYSVLLDEHCSDHGIWFALGDRSGPPGLVAMVKGQGTPGGKDSKGRAIAPISVQLIRDSHFQELEHYLELSAKGKSCAEDPPPPSPPNCTVYRVTATFIGRIDGVSKSIHAAHSKRSSSIEGKGFGHMGMYDAELVVQSVEEVVAVDKSEVQPEPKP